MVDSLLPSFLLEKEQLVFPIARIGLEVREKANSNGRFFCTGKIQS